jgi:hypothetical protein
MGPLADDGASRWPQAASNHAVQHWEKSTTKSEATSLFDTREPPRTLNGNRYAFPQR